jgi:hypothetical protein
MVLMDCYPDPHAEYTFEVGAADTPKTGFLVIAPDRGFLGNQEIRMVFEESERPIPRPLSR